jgi:hypothetical protein
MTRLLPFLLVGGVILVVQGSGEAVPVWDNTPKAALPVGKWKVEFANGVNEVVDIGNGGESSVEEPQRRCVGMAEVQGGSVVITFGDDRVERWTLVGKRYVVEHWFLASRLPTVTPVLGIAELAP